MSTAAAAASPPLEQHTITFAAPPVVSSFIQDTSVVTGYFGPFGCGKTAAGAFKAWLYGQAWPGARIAVIRDTWPNLRDTTQKTFFEWFPHGVAGTYERTARTFWMHTGQGRAPIEVIFRAMEREDDVKNVLSLDLAAAWIDEPQGGLSMRSERNVVYEPGLSYRLFQALYARLGRQKGYPKMLWLTGNPPDASHWIAREFAYEPGPEGNHPPTNPRPGFRLYLGDQTTNRAHLPARYYEDLEALYGVGTPMWKRFLRGLWIPFAASKPFRPEWIGMAGEGEPERPKLEDLMVYAGFDPAVSQRDTANHSAIVVAGQSRKMDLTRGLIFVLEARKGHWTPGEQADQIIETLRRWPIRSVRIEDVAYQKALADILQIKAQLAGVVVHVDLVKPDGDKLRRANAWSGLVQTRTVLFGTGQQALISAMLAVPEDKQAWDLVDAAGICLSGFPTLEPAQAHLPREEAGARTRARSYAVRPPHEEPVVRPTPRRYVGQAPDTRRRAAAYAVRPTPGRRAAPLTGPPHG